MPVLTWILYGKYKKIEPYVPGEQPKDKQYIKLNTNENPYPPSKKVMEAMKNTVKLLYLYLIKK